MKIFKSVGKYALLLVLLFGLVIWLGPREPVSETITFNKTAIGVNPDAYLAKRESVYDDITPGAQKQIVWHDPATKRKTPLAIVYIHGFSATLEEVRPLPDIIAKEMGANLFYTRLSGHGRGGEAMAEPTVNDWLNDTAEALEIGRSIGEQVVVISVSTGGTFSTWAATKPELMADIVGMVLISPNYGLNNPAAPLLTFGAARYWLPALVGAQRSFEATSPEHGKWWTSSYPTVAVLPMAESVRFVNGLNFADITVPALFIFSEADGVVSPDRTKEIAAQWGTKAATKVTTELVTQAEDEYMHVIAGKILSPSNSEPLAQKTINWIKSL